MIPVEYVEGQLAIYRIGSRSGKFPDGHLVTIEFETGEISCSCRGFQFHGHCHHTRSVRDLIGKGGTQLGSAEHAVG